MLVDMMIRLAVLGEINNAKEFDMHTAAESWGKPPAIRSLERQHARN